MRRVSETLRCVTEVSQRMRVKVVRDSAEVVVSGWGVSPKILFPSRLRVLSEGSDFRAQASALRSDSAELTEMPPQHSEMSRSVSAGCGGIDCRKTTSASAESKLRRTLMEVGDDAEGKGCSVRCDSAATSSESSPASMQGSGSAPKTKRSKPTRLGWRVDGQCSDLSPPLDGPLRSPRNSNLHTVPKAGGLGGRS